MGGILRCVLGGAQRGGAAAERPSTRANEPAAVLRLRSSTTLHACLPITSAPCSIVREEQRKAKLAGLIDDDEDDEHCLLKPKDGASTSPTPSDSLLTGVTVK